ncbi:MAG: zinc-binding dehydrogenase [Woeseiaceae bacterium]
MAHTNLQLCSMIRADGKLEISLADTDMPTPAADEVVVRIEAAPLNPSDLAVLFGPADLRSATAETRAGLPVIVADVAEKALQAVAARVGKALPVGNEGAGVVVAAGESDAAQALLGTTVGLFGGGTYRQFHCVNIRQCLPLPPGTTPQQGASCFVNPMTALAMVETMRMEGHEALVHTAAASNLGQMLNRVCIDDGIKLVNIVRKAEQAELLRAAGANYICNSSDDNFRADLVEALSETKATIAFDAIGGGRLAGDILACMEAAAAKAGGEYSVYGSETFKQVYIYGSLDRGPTTLMRSFGFAWSVGGFLLTPFLKKISMEQLMRMRSRVADEITTTFASHYADSLSLTQAVSLEAISAYATQATGQKFLLQPQV